MTKERSSAASDDVVSFSEFYPMLAVGTLERSDGFKGSIK